MKTKHAVIPAAVLAAVVAGSLVIGDVRSAEYRGSAICQMCHKITHEKVVEGYGKSGHPKALQKPDAEGAIVADFSTNPVFTRDEVAYVLGKGRNEQAFLDADFKVLPAKWNVKAKTWRPIQPVDGATQCIGCHVTSFSAEKKSYAEAGVGCEACHGPGSEHVAAGTKETIVNPKNLTAPRPDMVCGQCHSAGKDTTGKFAHPVGFRPGDDLAKAFADAKPAAPGSNQQYSEHIRSKHAVNGPGCADCHDPHNVTGVKAMLKKPVNDLCMDCHADTVKDMATHAPNAAADATCASCHMPGGQHRFAKIDE